MQGDIIDEGSLRRLVADLRSFEQRKEAIKAMSAELRKELPAARVQIRAKAVSILPRRNGAGAWVARSRIGMTVRLRTSRTAGVTISGGRANRTGRSDIKAIDRGRLRAPSWGRRGPGEWHMQAVEPGFFTDTVNVDLASTWHAATVRAIDVGTRMLRDG